MATSFRTYRLILTGLIVLIPAVIQAQYVDLLRERIAHYPIHNGALDISGFNNHGQVTGAILTGDRQGNSDHAYQFDGVDDHIMCGSELDTITSSLTVSCWVRTKSSDKYSHLVSKYDFFSDRGFILGIQDGLVKWAGRIGSGQFINMTSASRIDDDQWHHVMGVIEGSTWTVYVDGRVENQLETGNDQTVLFCTEPLTIGMYHRGDGENHRYFEGFLDDIILYKRALNACELEVLHTGIQFRSR